MAEHAHINVPLPDSNTPTYTLRNIEKSKEGQYICSVRNDLGSPEATADITVLGGWNAFI